MEQINYGIENFGRLKTVLLHRPDVSIKKVTEANKKYFLFDRVPTLRGILRNIRNTPNCSQKTALRFIICRIL